MKNLLHGTLLVVLSATMRRQLTIAEQIRGTRRALASPKCPEHLRASLRRHLQALQQRFEREKGAARRARGRGKKILSLRDWLGF